MKGRFRFSGYYFIGLVALALAGFWPSYFSKFFSGNADFSFYFHFHAFMAMLWIALLIMQPLLVLKNKITWHRRLGRVSYVLFPLLFLSVLLLAHSRHTADELDLDLALFVPFKDLLVLAVAYFIAIRYRHRMEWHARGMIVTGIVFIEPALIRLISNTISLPGSGSYILTIVIIYSVLLFLIVRERSQKTGRWIFPLVLGLYMIVHAVLLFGIHISTWMVFCKWFIALPLT